MRHSGMQKRISGYASAYIALVATDQNKYMLCSVRLDQFMVMQSLLANRLKERHLHAFSLSQLHVADCDSEAIQLRSHCL